MYVSLEVYVNEEDFAEYCIECGYIEREDAFYPEEYVELLDDYLNDNGVSDVVVTHIL